MFDSLNQLFTCDICGYKDDCLTGEDRNECVSRAMREGWLMSADRCICIRCAAKMLSRAVIRQKNITLQRVTEHAVKLVGGLRALGIKPEFYITSRLVPVLSELYDVHPFTCADRHYYKLFRLDNPDMVVTIDDKPLLVSFDYHDEHMRDFAYLSLWDRLMPLIDAYGNFIDPLKQIETAVHMRYAMESVLGEGEHVPADKLFDFLKKVVWREKAGSTDIRNELYRAICEERKTYADLSDDELRKRWKEALAAFDQAVQGKKKGKGSAEFFSFSALSEEVYSRAKEKGVNFHSGSWSEEQFSDYFKVDGRMDNKWDIWQEGYCEMECEGIPEKAQLVAKGVIGATFMDALHNYSKSTGFRYEVQNGRPFTWFGGLFPTEKEAREKYG